MILNKELSVSIDIKNEILKKYIEPSYIYDIKYMIKGKRRWKLCGQIFETLSKIFVAIGCILSFSSGYYQGKVLSFISGSVSTISLAMLQFSSFSFKENKKQSQELNILLNKIGLDTIPVFDRNIDISSGSKQLNNNVINNIKDIYTRDNQILEYLDQFNKKNNNIDINNIDINNIDINNIDINNNHNTNDL
jgi:hypothetical protein